MPEFPEILKCQEGSIKCIGCNLSIGDGTVFTKLSLGYICQHCARIATNSLLESYMTSGPTVLLSH